MRTDLQDQLKAFALSLPEGITMTLHDVPVGRYPGPRATVIVLTEQGAIQAGLVNPQDEFWQTIKAGELIEFDPSKSCTLNFSATFGSDAESILGVFQAASGVTLSDPQLQTAISTGLEVAATGEPSIRSLVERWAQEEELENFAAAVKTSMTHG